MISCHAWPGSTASAFVNATKSSFFRLQLSEKNMFVQVFVIGQEPRADLWAEVFYKRECQLVVVNQDRIPPGEEIRVFESAVRVLNQCVKSEERNRTLPHRIGNNSINRPSRTPDSRRDPKFRPILFGMALALCGYAYATRSANGLSIETSAGRGTKILKYVATRDAISSLTKAV